MGSTYLTKAFWLDAADRAFRTASQSAITALGGDAFNVWAVNWQTVAGISAGAALFSVLTSIVTSNIGDKGTASLVKV